MLSFGWLRRRPKTVAPGPERRTLFSWTPGGSPWLPGGTYVGTSGLSLVKVRREEALTVPAVLRGRNLICSIAALPLRQVDKDNEPSRTALLDQLTDDVANVVTLAMTVEDLLFDGVSHWQVMQVDSAGFPTSVRHLDNSAVSETAPPGYPVSTLPSGAFPNGVVWVMGMPTDRSRIKRFHSPNPPILTAGAPAIRRAIKLTQTAEMYADDPEARAYWTPAEGADPADDTAIADMLADYEQARRSRSEAYIPAAVKRHTDTPMTPVDLQLAELQARSDVEIANLCGIDPENLGVSTTSRTYANAVDRRVDKVNETLALYMRAVTDRLSMNDITRRGHRVEFDLAQYMQADPATRWATYATGIDKQILSVPEVRARENLPAVPVEPAGRTPTPAPAPAQAPAQGAPAMTDTSAVRTFATDADSAQAFTFDDVQFKVDAGRRTVAGLLVPYGQTAMSGGIAWRFEAGALTWPRASVSRVKLLRDHAWSDLLGSAVKLTDTPGGLHAAFKVARGVAGDEALSLAEDAVLDGLSAGVVIEQWHEDPADPSVRVVTSAKLREGSLTASPAFDDARLTAVRASNTSQEGTTMSDDHQTTAPVVDFSPLTKAVDAFSNAVEKLGTIPAEQRAAVVPMASTQAVREPLVYSLNGLGHSFVRDAWNARNAPYGSVEIDECQGRLRKYAEQTAELQSRGVTFANAGNTTDQAQIIPAGYRPELYVGQVPQGRPLFDAIGTRITLANATPFKVPVWVGSADMSGTNSEGTGPSTGTITDHTYRTVTPTAQSGEFVVTRELMDSANPAIDTIALNAMREEYAQDTEAIIAAAIAAATDDGTPVQGTSSTSTEGCYVYTVTGSGNDLAIDGIRFMEAEFGAHRFIGPNRLLASPTGYGALARAIDDIGRPLFPFAGPGNVLGTVGQSAQSLTVDGLTVPNAWSMTSTYDDILLFNSIDMLVGESPLLTFRFEEKGGPENIYLNIWGYFAFQILRYTGIHTCNYTAA